MVGSTLRRSASRSFGFTLVELLVVLAIIAVLISLLMPSLKRVRDQSHTVVCASNLRQLGLAFTMYANDNKGRLPNLSDDRTNRAWYNMVAPYMGMKTKDKSLGDKEASYYRFGYNGTDGRSDRWMYCPAREPDPKLDQNYGVNYPNIFSYAHLDQWDVWGTHWYEGSAKLAKVPARVYLAADARVGPGFTYDGKTEILHPNTDAGWGSLNYDYDKDGIVDSIVTELFGIGPYNGIWPAHGGPGRVKAGGQRRAANFLFADGSVRLVTIAEWAQTPSMWGSGVSNPPPYK